MVEMSDVALGNEEGETLPLALALALGAVEGAAVALALAEGAVEGAAEGVSLGVVEGVVEGAVVGAAVGALDALALGAVLAAGAVGAGPQATSIDTVAAVIRPLRTKVLFCIVELFSLSFYQILLVYNTKG